MNYLEARQALAGKLDIDYASIAQNGLFSDDDLKSYIQIACLKVWDYKMWDFTEGAKSYIMAAGDIANGYVDYPVDFQTGIAFNFVIGGQNCKPILFKDFLQWRTDFPTSKAYLYSQYKREVFFNPNLVAVSTVVDFYGKLRYQKLSNDADNLPFSPDTDNQEDSGNNIIVQLAFAEALDSEKKKNPAQATTERQAAYQLLDVIWKPVGESHGTEQSKNTAMFDVPDFFAGRNGRVAGSGLNNNTGKFDN